VAVSVPGGERDRDGLLAAADAALYRAKGAGRNRVMISDAVAAVRVAKAPAPRRARKG
jgi:hypothetical protein